MIILAIRTAQNAFRIYRTRNPYEIMDAMGIQIRNFHRPESLLGFFTVESRDLYIGLNDAANEIMQLTAALHELGHALNDYKKAASGVCFEDYIFFSLSHPSTEFYANITGAELFIADEYILDQIHYEEYVKLTKRINSKIDRFGTEQDRKLFREEQMLDFYMNHQDIPTNEQLAAELGVDVGVVNFKFKALDYKGYKFPNLTEPQCDFLKNWRKCI